MNTTDKATTRPWRVLKDDITPNTLIFGEGYEYQIVETEGEDNTIAEANAELIVRAVNSHDALVEALNHNNQMLSQQMNNWSNSDDSNKQNRKEQILKCWAQIDRNLAVIKLAKGDL